MNNRIRQQIRTYDKMQKACRTRPAGKHEVNRQYGMVLLPSVYGIPSNLTKEEFDEIQRELDLMSDYFEWDDIE